MAEKDKKENWKTTRTVIIAISITALCLAIFIFIMYLIGKNDREEKENNTPETQDTINENFCYKQLLNVLNNAIKTTSVDEDEQKANTIISFSYENDSFYLSGYNDTTIYSYYIDLSKEKEVDDLIDAFEFVVDNDVSENYQYNLVRYAPTEAESLINKYGEDGKYKIGTVLTKKMVFATLKSGEDIKVINNVELSTSLESDYTPLVIHPKDYLFGMYKYITEK